MATPRRAAGKKKGAISVDFSGVETATLVDEGDYEVKVNEVEQKDSSNGNPMLVFEFEIVNHDQFSGKKLFHNCSLQPQALFNLRGVLEALGVEVPDGAMDLDPTDLIDMTCGVSVGHEKYEGKTRAKISEFFPLEEEAAPSAPAAGKKKPVAKKAAVEEPSFKVGQAVSFSDENGDEVTGKITALNDDSADVKVGKEVYEVPLSDLTA